MLTTKFKKKKESDKLYHTSSEHYIVSITNIHHKDRSYANTVYGCIGAEHAP